ncbi:MAG TPA: choice-of-anchor tandem repeat GloVer-containing protein [Candidatus Cybelea sp.]|jgi:uncharacterized repeat protein (TIGR03803 family)|nr:choice-of-anchor tandem repeat GloVer-containing protein [Candidatus Cybelea sp.]
MKLLLRLAATAALASAAACGHLTAVTPAPVVGAQLGVVRANVIPRTVHVIPFFNYGKGGYDVAGGFGNGGFIGTAAALYGATEVGGSPTCSTPFDGSSSAGCGIVYRLVPNAGKKLYKLDTLHAFEGAPSDGAASFATLLADKSGDLFGTTFYGGEYNGGTVFELRPSSSGHYTETILHSFGYGQDGAFPFSGVIAVRGVLYGTTLGGGAYSNDTLCGTYGGSPNGTCGTVYSLDPASGAEEVLHSFGEFGDGANPYAALLDVNGTLYGTTDLGGSNQSCGTVFSIGTDGSGERIVHSFLNAPRDGCDPFASLIDAGGTLYGTTCCGGGNYCANHCEGTLFSIDIATGQEEMLHKFGNGTDGSEPVASLLDVKGVLYGTATIGGGTACLSGIGCGTEFSFAPSTSNPTYKTVHRFKAKADGFSPHAALLYSRGEFFGTTVYGGAKGRGTGVKLTP